MSTPTPKKEGHTMDTSSTNIKRTDVNDEIQKALHDQYKSPGNSRYGRIRPEIFRLLLAKNSGYDLVKTFIETGTYSGIQNQMATDSGVFDTVYGIELSKHWAETTQSRNPNSIIIHGDTAVELPKVLEKYTDDPVFLYLDAHYCQTYPPIPKTEFPLWKELQMIKDRGMADIVAIDDIDTFGKVREDLKATPDAVEWEAVTTKSIDEFFGDLIVDSLAIDGSYIIWLSPS